LSTINTPKNPKAIADHLLIPIYSFKKNLAKIDTKKGQEKKSALAVARGMYVKEIKKAEKAKKCKMTLTKVRTG
jgi:hypothetical protein